MASLVHMSPRWSPMTAATLKSTETQRVSDTVCFGQLNSAELSTKNIQSRSESPKMGPMTDRLLTDGYFRHPSSGTCQSPCVPQNGAQIVSNACQIGFRSAHNAQWRQPEPIPKRTKGTSTKPTFTTKHTNSTLSDKSRHIKQHTPSNRPRHGASQKTT